MPFFFLKMVFSKEEFNKAMFWFTLVESPRLMMYSKSLLNTQPPGMSMRKLLVRVQLP